MRIVFLDRDGTVNVDFGYVSRPDDVVLLAGAAEAIGRLKRAGYIVVIVSNQSAIGRGMASAAQIEATNDRLCELLRAADTAAIIDLIVYCPHAPEDRCLCRKPQTGLSKGVEEKWSFSPTSCWIVGDKMSDIEFGINLGIPPEQRIFLRPIERDSGMASLAVGDAAKQCLCCASLSEAADLILRGDPCLE